MTDIHIQGVCLSCLEYHNVLELSADELCPRCTLLNQETDGSLLELLSPKIIVTYPNPLFKEA